MTMPSRNYAILTENSPHNPVAQNGEAAHGEGEGETGGQIPLDKKHPNKKDGVFALHEGEVGCGTTHRAASSRHGKAHDGSLDIAIRVEIDPTSETGKDGKACSYGLTVPCLEYVAPPGSSSSSSRPMSSWSRSSRFSRRSH